MEGTAVEVATEVDAPVERVWQVLTGLDGYASWHPQIATATGELRLGGRIVITTKGPEPALEVAVVVWDPPRRFVCEGGDPAYVLVRHSWSLTDLGGGRTRVEDHEEFLGPQAAASAAAYWDQLRARLVPIVDALARTAAAAG